MSSTSLECTSEEESCFVTPKKRSYRRALFHGKRKDFSKFDSVSVANDIPTYYDDRSISSSTSRDEQTHVECGNYHTPSYNTFLP